MKNKEQGGPAATVVLLTYNQEEFVREAVEAVLSQTYSPLQVILSDDCSSDRTFEIMAKCARDYVGPHDVVLNQNEENIGIGAHVDLLSEMADGSIIVAASGDDVSLPNRVEKLVGLWMANDCKADSLCSDAFVINADGNHQEMQIGRPYTGSLVCGVRSYFSGIQGATHAWTKRSYKCFGPMLPGTVCEDRVIALRSYLLGGVGHLNEALVKYRIHGRNISHYSNLNFNETMTKTAEIHERNANISDNYIKDIDHALAINIGDKKQLRLARRVAVRMRRLSQVKADFILASTIEKMFLLVKTAPIFPMQSLRFAIILLAPSLYKRQQVRNLGQR